MISTARLQSFVERHPVLAERAALALMARDTLQAADWAVLWRGRSPPVTWLKRPGHCPICRQRTYAGGAWWPDAGPARANKRWHACCLAAWQVWTKPGRIARHLAERQGLACSETGRRLNQVRHWTRHHRDGRREARVSDFLLRHHIDHRVPLWRVRLDAQHHAWPAVLRFWGPTNLQVLTPHGHRLKTAREAAQRANGRRAGGREPAEAGLIVTGRAVIEPSYESTPPPRPPAGAARNRAEARPRAL